MGKKQTTTDILSSPFKGVSIDIRNKMNSAFALDIDTLDPEDYITYRVLLASIASGGYNPPSPITTSIPAGTSLGYDGSGYSFSIPFDPSVYGARPRIEVYLSSGRTFGWVDRGIDGSNVNVYLPNDGTDAPVTIDDYQVTISV